MYAFVSNLLEPVSYGIYFLALFLRWRKNSSGGIQWLLANYALATTLMLIASWLAFEQRDNRWLYNLLCLATAVFIPLYFQEFFRGAKKRVTIGLCFLFIIYFAANNLLLKNFSVFDSIGHSLLSVMISILAFMYFHQSLRTISDQKFSSQFTFWLVCSFLVYYVVSFGIFLTYHNLTNKILETYTDEERHLLTGLWVVHNVMLFLSSLIVLFGTLWTTYRNR